MSRAKIIFRANRPNPQLKAVLNVETGSLFLRDAHQHRVIHMLTNGEINVHPHGRLEDYLKPERPELLPVYEGDSISILFH